MEKKKIPARGAGTLPLSSRVPVLSLEGSMLSLTLVGPFVLNRSNVGVGGPCIIFGRPCIVLNANRPYIVLNGSNVGVGGLCIVVGGPYVVIKVNRPLIDIGEPCSVVGGSY